MKRIGGFNCVAVLHVKSQEFWLIPLISASMIVASIILSNTLEYSSLIPREQHEPRISFRFTRLLCTFLRLGVNGTHAQAVHRCNHNLGRNRIHLLIGKQRRAFLGNWIPTWSLARLLSSVAPAADRCLPLSPVPPASLAAEQESNHRLGISIYNWWVV